jgi:hypothetical protein
MRNRKKRWIQKCDVDDKNPPIPAQIVSNEEFTPPAQTFEQKQVEQRLLEIASDASKRPGISRRQFLDASGGMAAAFPAMNAVFGRFFDVDESELFEPQATDGKLPKNQFIFDIRTHHVAAKKIIQNPPLRRYREAGAAWDNKDLQNKEHKWEDLYLANYIKEMFLDSDTVTAVITGLPAKSDAENVLPPAEIIETRAEINGLAKSRRIIAHGLFSPDSGRFG